MQHAPKNGILFIESVIYAKNLEYEAREKAIWDYNQLMPEGENRDVEQGLEQGLD